MIIKFKEEKIRSTHREIVFLVEDTGNPILNGKLNIGLDQISDGEGGYKNEIRPYSHTLIVDKNMTNEEIKIKVQDLFQNIINDTKVIPTETLNGEEINANISTD